VGPDAAKSKQRGHYDFEGMVHHHSLVNQAGSNNYENHAYHSSAQNMNAQSHVAHPHQHQQHGNHHSCQNSNPSLKNPAEASGHQEDYDGVPREMKHPGLSSSQQYAHYPSLHSLQHEVFMKKNDSNDSNKILQSIDNEPLQQPDNSRLQSQSSLVNNNNKDRESIPKHNEQQLNQYFGGVGAGSSNQQNEQLMNCFRMNSQLSNQSITNNACSLKKHMHNISNVVDQNCGEQDQDDSIRHLRSDF